MPIRLDKINVKNLGPLDSLDLKLGSLNLIYGQNETGKTLLVEFLLGSIFRHASKWNLREIPGIGNVTVSGLTYEPTSFSPTTKKKIEDYWEDDELGLPLNMARLLVVKGGELDLAGTPGGINREVLKTALTSEVLLDHIRNPISKTIQGAVLVGQEIQGANRGVLKDRQDLYNEIQKLRGLLDKVENEYSQGPLRQLEINITEIQHGLKAQESAKHYAAYKLRQEFNNLSLKKDILSDEIIGSLRENLHDFTSDEARLSEREKDLKKHQKASEHYTWLESAISIWESRSLEVTKKPARWLTFIGMPLLLIGLILLGINDLVPVFNFLWVGLPLALVAIGMIFYSTFRLHQWTSSITEVEERQSIQEEYKARFGKTLRGLSVLQEKRESIQKHYFQVEPLEKEIQEKRTKQIQRKSDLEKLFESLIGKIVQEKDWEKSLQDLKTKSDELTALIHTLDLDLEKLSVPEEQVQEEPVGEEYNPQRVIDLQDELGILENELEDKQQTLSSLKQVICHETSDDITISWEEALFHLRTITEKKKRVYRELTARIVAEIGVVQILDRIENEEDQKIQRDINTKEVTDLLASITGTYNSLDLVDDQVYVNDQYSQHPLSDLSTGAREQIQLALRMGIASRLNSGDPLFIILDDAFQHSDWERRESLVKSVIGLIKQGWQVTYLSMDDHIRDLFLKHGKTNLKKEFKFFTLD
ncbi:MAG: ATP-binding protein [Anaerolineales bacterium]